MRVAWQPASGWSRLFTNLPAFANARMRARRVIDGRENRWARAFDNTLLALVAVSLTTLLLETVWGARLPETAQALIRTCNVLLPMLFTTEYLLRLWAAESRRKFALSFSGVIMLMSVLPFWLALGASEELRLFQFLTRIRRVFILARAVDLLRVRGFPGFARLPHASAIFLQFLSTITPAGISRMWWRRDVAFAAHVKSRPRSP